VPWIGPASEVGPVSLPASFPEGGGEGASLVVVAPELQAPTATAASSAEIQARLTGTPAKARNV
jgi:hypothetical protein